ncbi:anti-sigma factor family protein [Amnibacterium endophyticum]|uniref:Anti-sigma factor family protein n=1 Tax=Amnibacterium endophyticum TaxID=2109337 RepID=A0ABW4LIN8_9MICO
MTLDDPHHDLGAYVLGGLASTDRAAYEVHLAGCGRCRTDLAAVAGIPALLRTADLEPSRAPNPAARARLLKAGRSVGRKRWQRRAGVAAVSTIALAAAVTGAVVLGSGTAAPRTAFTATGASAVTGDAVLVTKPWGTAINLELDDLPTAGTFVLQIDSSAGRSETAATWSAAARPQVRITGATSVSVTDIRQIRVVRTDTAATTIATAPGLR